MKKLNIASLGLIALVAFTLGGTAQASVIVFKDSPTVDVHGDCTPGCTPDFQQLYTSSKFTSAGFITSIEFNYLAGDASTFTFSLSTSPATVNSPGLSANFAANIGADNQVFYSGPLIAPDIYNNALFVGTPFFYDPANGDLLLTITHAASTSTTFSNYIVVDTSLVNRNYDFSPGPTGFGSQSIGLETVFTMTDAGVPAPGALALLGLGLLGIGGMRRKKVAA